MALPTRYPRRAAIAVVLSAALTGGCDHARNALGDTGIDRQAAATRATSASAMRASVAALPAHGVRGAEALPLPTDFPGDVFVPAGYSVNSVMDSGLLQVVTLQSRGRVSTLFADARGAMRAQGWTQTLAMQNAADSAMLSFEKDGRAAVLSFDQTRAGDVTTSVQLRRAQ